MLEPLIAISVLAIGCLALAQFQLKVLAENSDNQSRMLAVGLADELVSQARLDATNARCYTLPKAEDTCASESAKTQAADWESRAKTTVPGYRSALAEVSNDGRFTLVLEWTSRAFKEPRRYEVTTDVRQ